MQLEKVSVEIRPRNPWEAMDLGVSMVQQWWRPVYRTWFTVLLPLVLVLQLIFYDNLFLAALVLWWLKPLLDRMLLHIYSHTVFGDAPSVRDTLRALPRLMLTGLFWHLTLLRLDPARSFRLPVMQLEGLSGKERRERYRVLARRGSSHAHGLTVICLHLESFIMLGLLGLLYLLVPQGWDFNPFKAITDSSIWGQVLWNVLYVLPLSLIEPAYVAAGFALYLNRRTELEGWDIELKFRRLAKRLEELPGPITGAAAAIVLAMMLSLPADPARAAISDEPLAPTALPAENIVATIDDVLAHDDFNRKKTYKLWVPKDRPDDEPEEAEMGRAPDWLQWLGSAIAGVVRVLLWGLLAAAVVLLIVYHKHWLPGLRVSLRSEETSIPTVSGFDLRPESLPDDIPATVMDLWRRQQGREALSLLYRGCVSMVVTRHRVELPESATEGDVLRLARGRVPELTGSFLKRTIRLWQALAYAHVQPSEPELVALCEEWHQSLQAAP